MALSMPENNRAAHSWRVAWLRGGEHPAAVATSSMPLCTAFVDTDQHKNNRYLVLSCTMKVDCGVCPCCKLLVTHSVMATGPPKMVGQTTIQNSHSIYARCRKHKERQKHLQGCCWVAVHREEGVAGEEAQHAHAGARRSGRHAARAAELLHHPAALPQTPTWPPMCCSPLIRPYGNQTLGAAALHITAVPTGAAAVRAATNACTQRPSGNGFCGT